MPTLLQQFFTWVVVWWEKFKGRRKVVKAPALQKHMSSVQAVSVDGFEMTIHVTKIVFSQNYDRWYVSARTSVVYDVYAIVSNDAPPFLKEATVSLQRSFPPFMPEYVSEEVQRRRVLEAYLDVLAEHIRMLKARQSH